MRPGCSPPILVSASVWHSLAGMFGGSQINGSTREKVSSNGSPHDTVSDLKRQKDSPHDEEVRVVVGDWSRPMYADVSSNGSPHEKVDSSGWFSTQELEESVVGSTHEKVCFSTLSDSSHPKRLHTRIRMLDSVQNTHKPCIFAASDHSCSVQRAASIVQVVRCQVSGVNPLCGIHQRDIHVMIRLVREWL